MPHAVVKKSDDSLGSLLRRTRRMSELELEQVSIDTSISVRNLLSLERNEIESIPEEVYRLHTLRTYSQYLGLRWTRIAPLYEALKRRRTTNTRKIATATNAISKKHFWDSVNIVRNTVAATLLIGGVGLLCAMGYGATTPPKLTIDSPTNNSISKEEKVTVKGTAQGAVALRINGESIALDSSGHFNQDVTLQTGVNTIAISAQKKYSRETVEYRKVLWQSFPVAKSTVPNNEN